VDRVTKVAEGKESRRPSLRGRRTRNVIEIVNSLKIEDATARRASLTRSRRFIAQSGKAALKKRLQISSPAKEQPSSPRR
jgi:hypothetical protein